MRQHGMFNLEESKYKVRGMGIVGNDAGERRITS